MPESFHDEPLSKADIAYERQRLRNKIHDLVLDNFKRVALQSDMTRAKLARRLDKRPEQITRWLSAPGNWTIDTMSDLMLAMGLDPASLLQSSKTASESVKPLEPKQRLLTEVQSTRARGSMAPAYLLPIPAPDASLRLTSKIAPEIRSAMSYTEGH